MYRAILLPIILCMALAVKADVIMEGTVYKSIMFTNLNDYPEYEFCITYQTYRYDRGYQPAGEVTVPIKQGEQYQPPRGGEATLTAKHKTNGTELKGDKLVGGTVEGARRRYVLDKIKIEKITDTEIVLDIKYGSTTRESHVKHNGLGGLGWWGVIPMSAFALGLLVWQIHRRHEISAAR